MANKNFLQALTKETQSPVKALLEVPKIEVEDEAYEDSPILIISSFGEILDLAIHLQDVEKKKVLMHIPNSNYQKIGDGIVEKVDDFHQHLGKGYIFVVDGCEHAKLQDWLREQGEYVVGTNEVLSELEENRQKGQELFKKAGFKQPMSKNFKSIDDALDFVKENSEKRLILKQNGGAPKSINHMGKFDSNIDMIYHLEELKKKWNETDYGAFDCDLMEIVDGVEIAVSAFFNGHDWLRDSRGKVVGFLNFEEKKESDGGTGITCGEMGTLFFGTDEDNKIFKDILLRPEIVKVLKDSDYRGVFDINGCLTEDGYVAFEPTSRFGIPATSYEFMEGLKSSTYDLLCSMAMGLDNPIEIVRGWGMCQVVVAPPFPVDADVEDTATSLGEKLWILEKGEPTEEFTPEQKKHIHLENFYKDDEGNYKVATKNGYMLVVTASGKSIKSIREHLLKYIKENLYLPSAKYRFDLGKRVEDSM